MPENPPKDLFFDAAVSDAEARAIQERHAALWEIRNKWPERFRLLINHEETLRDSPAKECLRHADAFLRVGDPHFAYWLYDAAWERTWDSAPEGWSEGRYHPPQEARRYDPLRRAEACVGMAKCQVELGGEEQKEACLRLCLENLIEVTQGINPEWLRRLRWGERRRMPQRNAETDTEALALCVTAGKLTGGSGPLHERYVEFYRALRDFYAKDRRTFNDELRLFRRIEEMRPGQSALFPGRNFTSPRSSDEAAEGGVEEATGPSDADQPHQGDQLRLGGRLMGVLQTDKDYGWAIGRLIEEAQEESREPEESGEADRP